MYCRCIARKKSEWRSGRDSKKVPCSPPQRSSLLRQHSHMMAGLTRTISISQSVSIARQNVHRCRHIHSSPLRAAVAHPVTAHGPPPKAPAPSPEFEQPVEQRKDVDSVTENEPRARPSKVSAALKKRFWKDVHVHEKPGMFTRPVALPPLNQFKLTT